MQNNFDMNIKPKSNNSQKPANNSIVNSNDTKSLLNKMFGIGKKVGKQVAIAMNVIMPTVIKIIKGVLIAFIVIFIISGIFEILLFNATAG